jgi:hypothetical protein
MDLYVLDGNLTSQIYRDNVLAPRVVPYFDNHALADRSMFIYHPERRDYDVAKMGFKTGAGKT